MRNKYLLSFFILFCILTRSNINAQTTSASNNLVAQPIPDRTVLFNLSDAGVAKPLIWGLDLAWLSEENVKRGVAFMGKDKVDLVRASFTPTAALVNNDLPASELATLNERLRIIASLGSNTQVVLNCDHPSVASWYVGNAPRWAQLIDVTTRRVQEAGRTVVSVSPFNEPDFGWGQYTGSNGKSDFYNIAVELKKNARFNNIRISGGNTLNCDQALPWYNYLKSQINEGNTHQLAGSFNNFATFFTTVRANGHVASADECHNVMEPMVGVEYGLQTAIWWGTAELARGEFVKASSGRRLGYAEHRPNWTAASVYRHTNGKVQAFGGTSERQAVNTSFRYVSKDRDVYYDGNGPQREFTLTMPGGTAYQTGQTNAEKLINITWGDDIQPVVNGKFILVNRNSGKVMEVPNGSTSAGAYLRQNTSTGVNYQQWNVTPVDSRIGGDFSYFTIQAVHSGKVVDVYNWSFNENSPIDAWDNNKTAIQQWYFEYAGDGYFFIRSRFNNKCLDIQNSSQATANIVQKDKTGNLSQQWRLIPTTAQVEFVAPAAPSNLTATAQPTSIRLEWSANSENDLAGYNIYRSETSDGDYNTIARNLTSNSFIDNTVNTGQQYFYAIKAVDNALNRSDYSNEVNATASGSKDLVTLLQFNGNSMDTTYNLNHSAVFGAASYSSGNVGSNSIFLNGSTNFVQLPATIANHNELTIATWVNWIGTSSWQRIFDFGNSENENMFLTPKSGTGKLRFGIKNNGVEQGLDADVLPSRTWTHVAVTMSATDVKLYVNGSVVNQTNSINIKANDFKPVLNYIGRSQYADPLFLGNIDDFRVYNYTLSDTEIANLANNTSNAIESVDISDKVWIYPLPAKDKLTVELPAETMRNVSILEICSIDGRMLLREIRQNSSIIELDISDLPSGLYLLKLSNNNKTAIKKFAIRK